jgi:glycosyltransferase involved in cell wall biosynthesis
VHKYIAVSEFIKSQHVLAGFEQDKIYVKPNFVDTNPFKNISEKNPRSGVIYIGRISKSKGSEILKYLFDTVNSHFNIIGDGPELLNLINYCKKNNYSHVEFHGRKSQDFCFKLLSESVCSIVPSMCGESFSLSAAESMALNTPVVAFDIGGLGELMTKSDGGIKVNPFCKSDFATAVNYLLKHKTEACKLGLNGNRFVQNELNPSLNTRTLIGYYQDLLQTNRNTKF